VAEWQLAVYTDDLPGFTPGSPRLTYKSWGYRKVFQDNCCTPGAAFAKAFPMEPVFATSFPFLRSGTLRGGTGQHFQVTVPAGGQGVDVLVARSGGGPQIDPSLEARLAIVRLP
jgi:hypothetical protein